MINVIIDPGTETSPETGMGNSNPSLTPYADQDRFNAFAKAQGFGEESPVQVAFIGNSITWHAPAADIGWVHDHGMAASAPSADYARRVLQELGLRADQAVIGNFAELEREPIGSDTTRERLEAIFRRKPSVTILQLGDNVNSTQQLQQLCDNLCEILPTIKANSRQVLLLSTWWADPAKDSVIEKISELFGLAYVPIGDLFTSPNNLDRRERRFAHPGVDNHPQDWGMGQIAARLVAAIDPAAITSSAHR